MNNLAKKREWANKFTPIYIGVVFTLCMSNIVLAQSPAIEADVVLPLEVVLENEMTTLNLGQNQIQGFNERAVQKLEDFADAMTMLGDKEIEMSLRMEVAKATIEFFQSEDVLMRWYDLESKKIIGSSLDALLENTIAENGGVEIQFSNFSGNVPIVCPPPSCSWGLNFKIIQKPKNGLPIFLHATMAVVLEKREKYFGDKKREVWEVFLGEIGNLQFQP